MFLAGYLFKETHTDVHYVRSGHGQPGDDYTVNFSTDSTQAAIFMTCSEALRCVAQLMADFEPDPDYRWPPVTIDMTTGDIVKFNDTRWP